MSKNVAIPGLSMIYLFLFRVSVSLLMLQHGWPKLMKFTKSEAIKFADPIGIGSNASLILAVFAEVVCSVLIIIGFKTRLATIPLIITMLVVIFIVKLNDPIFEKESAILFLFSYGTIYVFGPGKYAADNKWK